jgi:hypothetical protein
MDLPDQSLPADLIAALAELGRHPGLPPSTKPPSRTRREQLVNIFKVQFVDIDDHLIFLLFKVLLAEEVLGLNGCGQKVMFN